MIIRLLPALLLMGCAVPTVDLPFDSDRDGLLDDEELDVGTDPSLPDSDVDGWLDGDEVGSYTDPLDPDDHPYAGGWPIGACRGSIDGSGWNIGFTVHNTANEDQKGDLVKLHDFCEVPYLLTYYSYSWGLCGDAQGARSTYNTYKDRGLFLAVIVTDDDTGGDPSTDFLQGLADSSGDSFPFMADHNSALYYASNHEVLLVAAGGVVVAGGEYTSEISADDIEAVLQ